MIQVHVYKNAAQVGQAAAALIAARVIAKPHCVLGLATGSSPIPTYQNLAAMYAAGALDFSGARSFNLDEYVGLKPEHPCSYDYFMRENLFNHINMGDFQLPNGCAEDMNAECVRYDAAIGEAGGIDLQLLGIGRNGHIGFNEPASKFVYGTQIVKLSQSTIDANTRFFASSDEVPRFAISLGIGGIMAARTVLLIATGADKADAIGKAVNGDIDPMVQASILRAHPDAIFMVDEAAAANL